jgi:hypothetical protein
MGGALRLSRTRGRVGVAALALPLPIPPQRKRGYEVSEVEQEQTQEHEHGDEVEGVPVETAAPVEGDDEEAEQADHDLQEDLQTDAEPEQPQALSEKDMEQRLKRLDRSSKVWRERVGTILEGDAAMLVPCPLCEPLIPGFVMPTPQTPERFPSVRTFMGDAQPVEWQQDPNTRTCLTCAGYGVVETGSHVESQERLPCTDCGGKGWQGTRAPVAVTGPMAPAPAPEANGDAKPTPVGPEPPEAAKLRAMGYTLIQPVGA